jgi:peptidoglycan hydrolase CwlO-like protein
MKSCFELNVLTIFQDKIKKTLQAEIENSLNKNIYNLQCEIDSLKSQIKELQNELDMKKGPPTLIPKNKEDLEIV